MDYRGKEGKSIFRMTLAEYIQRGNPALSHTTTRLICQKNKCSENQLRQWKLSEICRDEKYGPMAKREIDRWLNITSQDVEGNYIGHKEDLTKKPEVTKVVFRKFKNGEIIALFPQELGDSHFENTCSSYMHVGQHSTACESLVQCTKLANAVEYAELKRELEQQVGYILKVAKKITQADYRIRKQRFEDQVKFEQWKRGERTTCL